MSNRKAAGSSPRRRRRLGHIAAGLTASLMILTFASGHASAERIVLKSGEVIDGSIVEATRNTVVVRRSIGGMRQMRIQDIAEVRFGLPQGQQMAGEFLSWADGVYELRAGDEVVRLSEGGIVSREPRQETAEQPRRPPSAPGGQRQITAAAPSVAAERTARPAPGNENQSKAPAVAESDAAADVQSSAAGDTESQSVTAAKGATAAEAERQASDAGNDAAANAESRAAAGAQTRAAADADSEAAADADSQAAGDAPTRAAPDADSEAATDAESRAVAGAQSRAVAGEENAAVGDQASLAVGEQASLAVKASVDPPEPGARNLVFKIELSQPADQTVVLIYGTVDGTAKAGEDYEAQQGMVTLEPGARSAEVRVPLIEGQPEDGEKRFELVLMADPKVAEVVDRRVIATIKGTD